MAEARVRAVGTDAATAVRVVLLQETGGARRIVAVAVGEAEALAAAAALEQLSGRRPGTHGLIGAVIAAAGRRLVRVHVHTLARQVFLAELELDDGTRVDARTSDAVVLALGAGAAIDVAERVLAAAGVDPGTVTVDGSCGAADGLDTDTDTDTDLDPDPAAARGIDPDPDLVAGPGATAGPGSVDGPVDSPVDIEAFRRFLDTAVPDDFDRS